MAATLEISELPNGISFQVTKSRNLWRMLLEVVAGAIFIYFLLHSNSSRPLRLFLLVFVPCSVIWDLIRASRGTNVTLFITNLDFKSTGHAPEGYKPSVISRADIYNLEYRKATGGGDTPECPAGLYAEYDSALLSSGTCILPNIDQIQTEQIIEIIYRRFPDTCTLSGHFKSDLITLNLNQ